MMKLNLTKVVNGCRLGKIQNLGKAGDGTVDIPGCLLYTRTGSAPHLTHQTLHNVHGVPAMAQLTLSSLAEYHEVLAEYKKGIGSFIGKDYLNYMCDCDMLIWILEVLLSDAFIPPPPPPPPPPLPLPSTPLPPPPSLGT